MLCAVVENERDTLITELPCKYDLLVKRILSIGISKLPHEIKCSNDENEPIKVKISGNGEFESKLASLISSENTLSLVNTMCEFYQNQPYENKLDIKEAVISGKICSLGEFGKFILESSQRDVIEYYYCPLIANLYSRNEYGDLEDYPDEYDGSYLAPYEKKILELIKHEDELIDDNLAVYYDGGQSSVYKLKEIHFGTQNVNGVLYGCIRAILREKFTTDEELEFKDWLEGQCSDGYGEGLEQRPILVEDGEMYVGFWNSNNTWFIMNGEEFDEYLCDQYMKGVE